MITKLEIAQRSGTEATEALELEALYGEKATAQSDLVVLEVGVL